MNLFGYGSKHKDKLLYYDVFPLIFPLEVSKRWFYRTKFSLSKTRCESSISKKFSKYYKQ